MQNNYRIRIRNPDAYLEPGYNRGDEGLHLDLAEAASDARPEHTVSQDLKW